MNKQPYKWMTINEDKAVITIKVIPNSSKNAISDEQDALKIKLTAPPVDNKANTSLIEYLSKLLKTPKSSIELLSGQTSKNKRISIPTSAAEMLNLLLEK